MHFHGIEKRIDAVLELGQEARGLGLALLRKMTWPNVLFVESL